MAVGLAIRKEFAKAFVFRLRCVQSFLTSHQSLTRRWVREPQLVSIRFENESELLALHSRFRGSYLPIFAPYETKSSKARREVVAERIE